MRHVAPKAEEYSTLPGSSSALKKRDGEGRARGTVASGRSGGRIYRAVMGTDASMGAELDNLTIHPKMHELLSDDILSHILRFLDIRVLCQLKPADRRHCGLCRAELACRSTRDLFEYERLNGDWGTDEEIQISGPFNRSFSRIDALVWRAYNADFARDTHDVMFASSPAPRTARPAGMRFRVGDAFFNGESGNFGIIMGWDDRRREPFTVCGSVAETLYSVHYLVFELSPEFGTVATEFGAAARWRINWEIGIRRYIPEGSMLSVCDIWNYNLPTQPRSNFALYLVNAHSGGGSHGVSAGLEQMVKELWSIAFPSEPGPHCRKAAEFGFLPRPTEAELTSADGALRSSEHDVREVERGWGFMPGPELRERYPID